MRHTRTIALAALVSLLSLVSLAFTPEARRALAQDKDKAES
jgi:hypothetical protein